MKEFKKWLLTNEGQILVGDHRAKAAWRAALRWVLSNSTRSKQVTNGIFLSVLDMIKIEEELNEK